MQRRDLRETVRRVAQLKPGADGDPMRDVASLLDEVSIAGLDAQPDALVSCDLRFTDRDLWESAWHAAESSWRVSAFSRADGLMLRLTAEVSLTEDGLRTHREKVLVFAAQPSGR